MTETRGAYGLDFGTWVIVLEWGGRRRCDVVVREVLNIKNGRAGYDLASGHWCYASQIVEV